MEEMLTDNRHETVSTQFELVCVRACPCIRGGTINRYGDISRSFSMRYENRYLVPNIDILINTIRCSK